MTSTTFLSFAMPCSRLRAPWRLALVLLLAVGGSAWAAPDADPWPIWDRANAANPASIDHAPWQAFLGRNLVAGTDLNRVRYGAVSAADRALLAAYLAALQAVDPRDYRRDEQKAYWINLYNAATVQLVIDNYPVDSIRDIGSWIFSFGPWNRDAAVVAGEAVTYNDIEHRILRPLFRDPLVHFGLNCASVGCPDLVPEAYTGANVDRLLAENARAYLRSPRGVRFAGNALELSSIFDWFSVDFGGRREAVLEFVATYSEAGVAPRVRGWNGPLRYRYDWSLNDAR